MNYENYKVEDFANDAYFIKWVKAPDAESKAFWENWQALHPDKKSIVEEARQLVIFLNFKVEKASREDFLEVKQNIKDQIRKESKRREERPVYSYSRKRHSIGLLGHYYKAAALFGGIMVSIALVYYLANQSGTEGFYSTGYGETRTITLPDHSTAILNANSTLKFTKNWEEGLPREVWLEGEAFFEVKRKTAAPQATLPGHKFIVHAEELNVEVLGTKFNVKNRRGKVKVVLNSGKVQVEHQALKKEKVVMKPGDLVEYSGPQQEFTRKKVKPENYTSWRYNKLIFDEIPVKEIAHILEDDYGVKVTFADASIAERKFTGSVPKENLDLFINVLAESLNVAISLKKKEVTFENKQ